MTAGTAVIMWLGELITDRGIGNGMSLLIFTSIAARFPSQGSQILQSRGATTFVAVLIAGLLIIVGIVFMEQGQRRIPVQYAKRMIGRRMYGGTSTYIPLKVNQAGVIPVIFSSSLLYLPQLLSQVWTSNHGFTNFVAKYFTATDSWSYIGTYALLTVFFTYFYVAITFNPVEVSDNMRKYGGFIPGIRPGRPTAEYLEYVLSRITLPGALYLTAIAVLPILALALPARRSRRLQPVLPLRRHLGADPGRGRSRHLEADREPADAAQLRRLLEIVRPPRPAVLGVGAPVRRQR